MEFDWFPGISHVQSFREWISRLVDAEVTKPDTRYRVIDSKSLENSFYKGEGNATLVVSLPHEKKVLRLKKSCPKDGDAPADDDGKSRVKLAVDFHRNILSGLLGDFVTEPDIVYCDATALKRYLKWYEPQRPAHRRHKSVVEKFATTLPDYTILPPYLLEKIPACMNNPTFCVEIKPKDEQSLAVSECKRCSKIAEGIPTIDVSSQESYCGRCLFSGRRDRMFLSLRSLIFNDRKKLKVFKNGEIVWSPKCGTSKLLEIVNDFIKPGMEEEQALDSLISLIYEALIRPFSVSEQSNKYLNSSESHFVSELPKNSVLERIQNVHKVHYRCTPYVYSIYSKYFEILNDEIVYSLNAENKNIQPNNEELHDLRSYLVHRVVRDCSILIAFRQIDSNASAVFPPRNLIRILDDRFIVFNVAITDLDPKSVHCIDKHMQKLSGFSGKLNTFDNELTDCRNNVLKSKSRVMQLGALLMLCVSIRLFIFQKS